MALASRSDANATRVMLLPVGRYSSKLRNNYLGDITSLYVPSIRSFSDKNLDNIAQRATENLTFKFQIRNVLSQF